MAAANARTSSLEARQAMGGDDPTPPTPTFEPVRRPSPAYDGAMISSNIRGLEESFQHR